MRHAFQNGLLVDWLEWWRGEAEGSPPVAQNKSPHRIGEETMTSDREYELLARIEQLKDELQAARTTIVEREQEIRRLSNATIRRLIRERDEVEDRLRAAQSQGAL